jgi:hypothetical protein
MASGPSGEFVVRAEPEGAPQGVFGVLLSGWFVKDRSKTEVWTIRIRRFAEDPFGHPVAAETVNGDEVSSRVEGWMERIRAGWGPD